MTDTNELLRQLVEMCAQRNAAQAESERLRAEAISARDDLDAARAEVERCIWNMAGISTIACAEDLSHYTPGQDWERPALTDVVRLVRKMTEVRAEVATVDAAISDRGVAERDCSLPLASRVDSLILDLKQSRCELAAAEMENTKLRAQLYADDQRAWETLGKPEGTYSTTNVQRLCAEVERLQEQVQCRGCGGTVGDHLAPDQSGCTGRFVIDGVEMVPAKHKKNNNT